MTLKSSPTLKNPNGGSIPAAYIIRSDGAGGAIAQAADAGLFSYSGTNPADVFQSAINALALQNGGTGGKIAFKDQHIWNKAVTLYPGIALVGDGPLGNKNVQDTGARIKSTVNGSTLIVTGVAAGNLYFPYLSNFSVYGDSSGASTSQDLIVLNNSGGSSINDVFMDHVTVFNAGRHGLVLDSTSTLTKMWISNSYLEGCVGDGLNASAGVFVSLTGCYIYGQTGYGIHTLTASGPSIYLDRNSFSINASAAVYIAGSAGDMVATGNSFSDNGANNALNPQVLFDGNVRSLVMEANNFRDSRGASAVQYHLRLSRAGWLTPGSVVGNTFDTAAQVQPVYANYQPTNKFVLANNSGYNDTFGKLASPFNDNAGVSPHVGMEGGGVAAPTASRTYTVVGAPLYVASMAGTGVSITIADPKGNTVQSGLATYAGRLEPGYTINFGAFSVAPTLYIGVV